MADKSTQPTPNKLVEPDTIEKVLEIFKPRWTALLLREAFYGTTRFTDFSANLGMSKALLRPRLDHLVAHGILRKELYEAGRNRYHFVLTGAGLDLFPVAIALYQWGSVHLADGPPIPAVLRHRPCGQPIQAAMICENCGQPVRPHDIAIEGSPRDESTQQVEWLDLEDGGDALD